MWNSPITSDPIGLDGGINTYSYALQNPVGYFDPNGEDWRTWVQAIGIAIGLSGTPGLGDSNPTTTEKNRPVKPGQVGGRQLPEPTKSSENLKQRRADQSAGEHKKNKVPSSGGRGMLPLWRGLGALGAALYPIPMGCGERDCNKNGIFDMDELPGSLTCS